MKKLIVIAITSLITLPTFANPPYPPKNRSHTAQITTPNGQTIDVSTQVTTEGYTRYKDTSVSTPVSGGGDTLIYSGQSTTARGNNDEGPVVTNQHTSQTQNGLHEGETEIAKNEETGQVTITHTGQTTKNGKTITRTSSREVTPNPSSSSSGSSTSSSATTS